MNNLDYNNLQHLNSIGDETYGTGKSILYARLSKSEWIEQQIREKNADKWERNKKRSNKIMLDYIGKYPCRTCFHGQTGNCEDALKNGCEYHFNRETEVYFPIEQLKKAV